MAGTLLIGYDVEFGSDNVPKELGEPDSTVRFLEAASKVHEETNAPATLFIVGQTLEKNAAAFQKAARNNLFDFQQHTYSHRHLKGIRRLKEGEPVPEERPKGGMSLPEIKEEVFETKKLIKEILGMDCIGLTAPAGCHLGLCDRPDILKALHEEGIRFLRTWGRNERGAFTFTFKGSQERVQPFWYEKQWFPDILEFPMHGNDYNIRQEMGWEKVSEYMSWVRKQIDDITEHNSVWSYAIHDHSGIKNDPEMLLVKQMIRYALEKGVTIRNYQEEYKIRQQKKQKNKNK